MATKAKTYRGAPVTDLDPFSHSFIDDQDEHYKSLRDQGPVLWLSSCNSWGVFRHQEVHHVLAHWEIFSSARGVGPEDLAKYKKPWRRQSPLLEGDPPVHTELKKTISKVLSPVAVKSVSARIQSTAKDIVGEAVARRDVDAAKDIATRFPLTALPDAFGLMRDGRESLLPYGAIVFDSFGPWDGAFFAMLEASKDHIEWAEMACRRENILPGTLGAEFFGYADRGEISEVGAESLVRGLVAAGLDTTISALAAAIYHFGASPSEWKKLKDNPGLSRSAFEEATRIQSPIRAIFRTTTRPVELGGTQLGEGEKVAIFLKSANHDPRRWDNPERFVIDRKTSGHVGFGHGIHMCAGQFLARLEGEILLGELADQASSIQLLEAPKPQYNKSVNGIESVRISLTGTNVVGAW